MLEDPLLILHRDEGWGLPAGDDDAGQLLHVYSTVQYSTVQYSTVQYSTEQYSTSMSSVSGIIVCIRSPGTITRTSHSITWF